MPSKTEQLNALFDDWERSYAAELRPGFHRDGIVDERQFYRQSQQIVFMLKEPNSTGGGYDQHFGRDLRGIYGGYDLRPNERPWRKWINQNVARWARALLDGIVEDRKLDGDQCAEINRRIAIMNLKKLSGSGRADDVAIAVATQRDVAFIRRELAIIKPTIIVAGGDSVMRLVGGVLAGRSFVAGSDVNQFVMDGARVLRAAHPAVRPLGSPDALRRLVKVERDSREQLTG